MRIVVRRKSIRFSKQVGKIAFLKDYIPDESPTAVTKKKHYEKL